MVPLWFLDKIETLLVRNVNQSSLAPQVVLRKSCLQRKLSVGGFLSLSKPAFTFSSQVQTLLWIKYIIKRMEVKKTIECPAGGVIKCSSMNRTGWQSGEIVFLAGIQSEL